MEYVVEKVKCDLCSKEWVAVHPVETKQLECPLCGNISEYYEVIEMQD